MAVLNVLKKMFWRMQYEKSKRIGIKQISLLAGPEGLASFYRFNDYLMKKTNTRLEPLFRLRLYEIGTIIRKYHVKNVYEMGAG